MKRVSELESVERSKESGLEIERGTKTWPYSLPWSEGSETKEGHRKSCVPQGRPSLPCPGEGNGYPLQYSCWKNSVDRGAWQTTDHGVAKSQTRLSE